MQKTLLSSFKLNSLKIQELYKLLSTFSHLKSDRIIELAEMR